MIYSSSDFALGRSRDTLSDLVKAAEDRKKFVDAVKETAAKRKTDGETDNDLKRMPDGEIDFDIDQTETGDTDLACDGWIVDDACSEDRFILQPLDVVSDTAAKAMATYRARLSARLQAATAVIEASEATRSPALPQAE